MSLKSKIFIGFSVFVLVIFSIFSIYTFNETTKVIISREEAMLEVLSESVQVQMNEQLETAETSVLTLANNREVQRLFAERDREALLSLLLPGYQAIDSKISQAQFHLPDSTSFLRLHSPEKFGDSLKDFRTTVNEANEKKEIVRGLEEGVAGYGFRIVVPVNYEGKHIGSFEYGSDFKNAFLDNLKESYEGEYFIYQLANESSTSEILAGTSETDNWPVEDDNIISRIKGEEIVYERSSDENYNVTIMPFKNYNNEVKGYVKIVKDRTELVNRINSIKRNSMIFTLILALFLFVIFYMFLTYSLRPINTLIGLANNIADGDLTQLVEINTRDEIGTLGRTFNKMSQNLQAILSQVGNMSENVAATSEELSASSEEVSASTDEVTNTIIALANSASEQVESIDYSKGEMINMAEGIGDLYKSIELINESVNLTLESTVDGISSSKEAVDKIIHLRDSTENTSKEINRLSESSREIENIVDTIHGISEQTNLLALNAAIEAARSGEAGRGFSVVAEEIRKLAEQSSHSSDQIAELIGGIQKEIQVAVESMETSSREVESGVIVVNNSSEKFEDIQREVNVVVKQMLEVGELTERVSKRTDEVLNNFETIMNMSQVTLDASQGVRSNSQEQAAAMEEIANATIALADIASELRDSISEFKY